MPEAAYILDSECANLTINDSVISSNSSAYAAGGVYASSKYGGITFLSLQISSNKTGAERGGTLTFACDGQVTRGNPVVTGNSAIGG